MLVIEYDPLNMSVILLPNCPLPPTKRIFFILICFYYNYLCSGYNYNKLESFFNYHFNKLC